LNCRKIIKTAKAINILLYPEKYYLHKKAIRILEEKTIRILEEKTIRILEEKKR